MKKKLLLFVAYLICSIAYLQANAGEKIFATYFDIPINSPAGTKSGKTTRTTLQKPSVSKSTKTKRT